MSQKIVNNEGLKLMNNPIFYELKKNIMNSE